MAHFMAMFFNSNKDKGTQLKEPNDYIIKSYWKSDVEQDVDTIKKAFGIK